MPSANLAAYLAKNYLNASNPSQSSSPSSNPDFADSSRPKKKRRKNKENEAQDSGLLIADDDAELSLGGARNDRDDEAEDVPMYDTNMKSAEFRKKKSSGWTVVDSGGYPAAVPGKQQNDEDAEAERIISEAAAESAQRRQQIEDEDAPAVVDVPQPESSSTTTHAPRMQSGARSGLQTAADTARLIQAEEREKARELSHGDKAKKSKNVDGKSGIPEEETIYRDATGRRIDVSLKRAEARRAEMEKMAAEKKARDEARGDVQRAEREQRKQDLEEAKFLTVARGADDEDMNRQLKDVVRWDDPMAMYMAHKKEEEKTLAQGPGGSRAGSGKATAASAAAPRRKVYQGAAPPNRYGIPPGWRWDGVDRGNGFEKDWFQARGRKARNEDLSYQWQMDE
ncbi:uncharacterized protein A1O9_04013 [Exophiala aquamarina CBS 119918]|uniref:Pre-mRNA-splicing factor cwc26 n=1 Tax=Exophiala aquamarina CBS 119918 TaxID=1182545 RepID=A0A072PGA1_9EURO|nr:uncharacterized protein A1O9_04013 [Exophiala aquamarina CBS 119918]KEF59169.1 hypothetical protein A1O9_04013 [Exophiala aquamarina CBS 119918]